MNGLHVEWSFIEPSGGGCIRIPSIPGRRFGGESDHYMGFGDDYTAMLFDEITAEGSTWLVREKDTGSVELIFASVSRGSDGCCPADSIAEYLQAAMEHGFVHYWPVKHKYADQADAVTRFQLPPVKPETIRPGVRVEFDFFGEKGRGEVLEVRERKSSTEDPYGLSYVQVKLDAGTTGWLRQQNMKAHKKQDAYERIRNNGFSTYDEPIELLDDLTRAIGLMDSYSRGSFLGYHYSLPSNARRAAGLFSTYSIPEALTLIVNLYEQIKQIKGLDWDSERNLAKTGQEFNWCDFPRPPEYYIDQTFEGLFSGISILLHFESFYKKVPINSLVDAALIERLKDLEEAQELFNYLDDKIVLKEPTWKVAKNRSIANSLGLSKDAKMYLGSGF